MKKSIYGKISIVVFLTVLIWVWADLAQDERLPLSNVVSVSVARSSDPTLWLSFGDPNSGALQPSVIIDSVDLKGPAKRVTDVDRMRNTGEFDGALFLDPAREGYVEEGTRPLDVLSFLRRNDTIRQLGLAVEDCEPKAVMVHVSKLVQKSLTVECVDENGAQLRGAEIEPPAVDAFVPAEGVVVARVRLLPAEQSVAKGRALERTPYVELADGQRRDVETMVKVTLPAGNDLREYQVSAVWGFCFSPNLQGKFQVELDSARANLANVLIKATPLAHQAYTDAPYQIVIHIYDTDKDDPDWIARPVVFNFPEEYVRRDEIVADQAPPVVRFRVVPIPEPAPAEAPPP